MTGMSAQEALDRPSAEGEVGRDLWSVVRRLEMELAGLREQLATEVRTRRIVVVDKDGREVIHSEERPGSISLEVEWPSYRTDDPGENSSVSLTAHCETVDAIGSGGAGLSVLVGGDVALQLVGSSDGWESVGGQMRQRAVGSLDLDVRERVDAEDGAWVAWQSVGSLELFGTTELVEADGPERGANLAPLIELSALEWSAVLRVCEQSPVAHMRELGLDIGRRLRAAR